ncbi:hypothetical protein LOD99_9321 [Oopsacas minuta]|uniref:Uncharacterized protein n=1 Tax=Oopsacas minuta TaxID=111878 RepID=A0AAV7JBY7_9METZ|nr:hypothetical protein LOD99_9321 [Oopsacas minuta]
MRYIRIIDNFILEMAEKVTSQTGSDNIYPKKRKISEKEDISFITLDIDKVCLSEGESFKLIESDVPTWSKPVSVNLIASQNQK